MKKKTTLFLLIFEIMMVNACCEIPKFPLRYGIGIEPKKDVDLNRILNSVGKRRFSRLGRGSMVTMKLNQIPTSPGWPFILISGYKWILKQTILIGEYNSMDSLNLNGWFNGIKSLQLWFKCLQSRTTQLQTVIIRLNTNKYLIKETESGSADITWNYFTWFYFTVAVNVKSFTRSWVGVKAMENP